MATFEPSRLTGVGLKALDSVGFRHQAPGFDARSGEGARRLGGGYNPPRSFPVIYLCLTKPCAAAELQAQATRQSVQIDDLLPRELWSGAARLGRVLDLNDPSVPALIGVDTDELVRPDHAFTQQIGEAAHERGVQAIKAPSATDVDHVLAVFPENLGTTTLHIALVEVWSSVGDPP